MHHLSALPCSARLLPRRELFCVLRLLCFALICLFFSLLALPYHCPVLSHPYVYLSEPLYYNLYLRLPSLPYLPFLGSVLFPYIFLISLLSHLCAE